MHPASGCGENTPPSTRSRPGCSAIYRASPCTSQVGFVFWHGRCVVLPVKVYFVYNEKWSVFNTLWDTQSASVGAASRA